MFLGLSAAGVLSREMVAQMADKPLIFAMANPDPEITPEEVHAVRSDAIMATGRSDYPNQINNVLCFPFIFRGALDVQATTINDAMKIAAAEAHRRAGARGSARSGDGRLPRRAPDVRPRLHHSRAVRSASHLARAGRPSRRPRWIRASRASRSSIMDAYVARLKGRLDPIAGWLQSTFDKVRTQPKRVIFAEGEDTAVIRAANTASINQGFGQPILVGHARSGAEALPGSSACRCAKTTS